jgi:hypothetical protein
MTLEQGDPLGSAGVITENSLSIPLFGNLIGACSSGSLARLQSPPESPERKLLSSDVLYMPSEVARWRLRKAGDGSCDRGDGMRVRRCGRHDADDAMQALENRSDWCGCGGCWLLGCQKDM